MLTEYFSVFEFMETLTSKWLYINVKKSDTEN
jgi:hypothetical protein